MICVRAFLSRRNFICRPKLCPKRTIQTSLYELVSSSSDDKNALLLLTVVRKWSLRDHLPSFHRRPVFGWPIWLSVARIKQTKLTDGAMLISNSTQTLTFQCITFFSIYNGRFWDFRTNSRYVKIIFAKKMNLQTFWLENCSHFSSPVKKYWVNWHFSKLLRFSSHEPKINSRSSPTYLHRYWFLVLAEDCW